MEKLLNVIALSLAASFKNYPKESFVSEFTIEDSSTPLQKEKKKKRNNWLMETLLCIYVQCRFKVLSSKLFAKRASGN